jgi:hypothetical protein
MKVGGRRREEDREVDANSGYNLTIVTVKVYVVFVQKISSLIQSLFHPERW